MNITTKWVYIGAPAIVGAGITWLGMTLLRNEMQLEQRRLELEVQVGAKSIVSQSTLNGENDMN